MAGDRDASSNAVLMAFISGAALGAAVAVLLAPCSGRESRTRLRSYAKRAEDTLRAFVEEAAETWEEVVDEGRDFVVSKKSTLREAVDAGRETMRRQADPSGGGQRKG